MKLYRKLICPVHCYPGQGYEPKTELVEKEEKWYPEEEREHLEEKYGYLNEGHFSNLIFEEKYEPCMLKEQEAKEQISDAIHETAKQFRQTIVRCKDCKHFGRYYAESKNGVCNKLNIIERSEDWFCADGERKDT